MDITFSFQYPVSLAERKRLRTFLEHLFQKEGKQAASLSIVFCSDEYLLKINRDFLQHDYYTDIITFDLSDARSDLITGEIYISVNTVRKNARRFQTPMFRELHRVIFHGVLHLCGYMDKTKKQQEIMRSKEDEYLQSYYNAS